MIELEQALDIIRSIPADPRMETIPLGDALGRVLPREVLSPIDSPPFDKSTMDGFAAGAGDDHGVLSIVESIAAGGVPARSLGPGECARIMTGAMLPAGTTRVIRLEYVREVADTIRIHTPETALNIVRRGSSIRAGQPVLRPGVIGAPGIGALAGSGIDRVTVAVPPRVAVLCTGPEIVPAGAPLGPGEIHDSNGPQLRAQLEGMRCPCSLRTGVDDLPIPLAAAIEEELASRDVLILTGGVSAGSFDYVPGCLRDAGAEILFHGVAVKPGKPALFARRDRQYIFGLPGNPVSTFVIFELFVKPFLYRRMGIDWAPAVFAGKLLRDVRRTAADRTEFLPVRVRQGLVEAVEYHGSAHLNALVEADGLIRIEAGVRELPAGTRVDVRPMGGQAWN